MSDRKRVVVVGGGFGGVQAALRLARLPVEYNYFGHDQWREPATDIKTLEGTIRGAATATAAA